MEAIPSTSFIVDKFNELNPRLRLTLCMLLIPAFIAFTGLVCSSGADWDIGNCTNLEARGIVSSMGASGLNPVQIQEQLNSACQ